MLSGSRRGEVCALRWHHIDLDRGILWVPRSIAQTKKGLKDKETKSGKHGHGKVAECLLRDVR